MTVKLSSSFLYQVPYGLMKLFHFLLDVFDNVTYSGYFLACILVWDSDIKSFLEFHDELYGVKRISTEIIIERSILGNSLRRYAKLVNDNLFTVAITLGFNKI